MFCRAQLSNAIALLLAVLVLTPWIASAPVRSEDATLASFVERIQSEDHKVRLAAQLEAPRHGAPAVVPLAGVMQDGKPQARISASHALTRIVHHAGRPGADAERRGVAAELARLTLGERAAHVRREALHLMGSIADTEAEVEAVARCLWEDDRRVAEAARQALERIPGKEAVKALVTAVRRASDEDRPHLMYSLAKKRDNDAAQVFTSLARAQDPRVRLAALEGLARLGSPQGVPVLLAALKDPKDPDHRRIFGEYLRLADLLFEGGKADAAREMYLHAQRQAPADYQRERALHRLAPPGDKGAVESLVAGLGDESARVRRLALERLGSLETSDVVAALRRAYEGARDESRPVILRALADRDASAAAAFVDAAVAGANVELKIVALDITGKLGDPRLAEDFLRIARGGSAFLRPVALRGYLEVAEGRLKAGEKGPAYEMFTRSLEAAGAGESRGRALRGLIAVGDPRAIALVEPLLSDTVLAQEASAGYVSLAAALGAAGDVDRAEAYLLKIVQGTFAQPVILAAAEELRKLGRDAQAGVKAKGFIVNWWLVGPIQDLDGKAMETKFFPEERVRLNELEMLGARRFRWQELKDLCLDGKVDLIPVFRRSERVVAYAYSAIDLDAEKDAVFHLGSDDGVVVWVNGERAHASPGPRSFVLDQDKVKVHLRAGANTILLKIGQQDGAWTFALRATDPEGRALVPAAAGRKKL